MFCHAAWAAVVAETDGMESTEVFTGQMGHPVCVCTDILRLAKKKTPEPQAILPMLEPSPSTVDRDRNRKSNFLTLNSGLGFRLGLLIYCEHPSGWSVVTERCNDEF